MTNTQNITLTLEEHAVLPGVFGGLDENVKRIEKAFGVSITVRGSDIIITGDETAIRAAADCLGKLLVFAQKGSEITAQTVNYLISETGFPGFYDIEKLAADTICLTAQGKPIKPKTLGQKKYVDLIRDNTIIFGTGPAGTGKTYLAMALAITAFKRSETARIILTRPAIEAGEKLGFLPGDMQQKVDPYLRPLYDALHEIMGADTFARNLEKGLIEVAPLAYMRGRTLDNSFIVLDEAQNTTHEQMKMFLTRIGFGSKVVVTGDLTQVDLPPGQRSGLAEAVEILAQIEGIGVCTLTGKDIVRHPLVQQIIKAYDKQPRPRAATRERQGERTVRRAAGGGGRNSGNTTWQGIIGR